MVRGHTEIAFAITGATGAVGGKIASRLAALGQGQRLVVRDAGRAPDLPNAEAVEASYEDTRALREALAGARTFFMVSAGRPPTERGGTQPPSTLRWPPASSASCTSHS